MKRKALKIGIGALGLAVGLAAVFALREATLSTHQAVDPDSRVQLVLDARSRHSEKGQTLPEMVEALLLTCRLEISSDLIGPIQSRGANRFHATLRPALDETNQKQLRGCLEDWTIDSLRVKVVRLGPS
jgi:hypothetical protein